MSGQGNSPLRPGSGHQWASGQSAAVLGGVRCADTEHLIGAQLDLVQGNSRTSWCAHGISVFLIQELSVHSGHMRPTIVLHLEEG